MWLDRLKLLINDDIDKLKNSTVAIIGLGGVGGSSLESIVRSGIGNIIIVDKDVVDITNLNRQIISNTTNIGELKVDVAEKRILSINPNCNVIKLNIFLDKSNINEVFIHNPNYIIDACDTIDTKVYLIKESIEKNIKIISSMGTGNKFNPKLLDIVDISKTSYDPLAKVMRKKLKDIGIKHVMVISSTEKPLNIFKPVGSNSFVPPAAGILAASYVINDILNN